MRKDQAELIERARRFSKMSLTDATIHERVEVRSTLRECAYALESLSRRPETDQAEAPKADMSRAEYRASLGLSDPYTAPVLAQAVVDAKLREVIAKVRVWLSTDADAYPDELAYLDSVEAAISPHNPTGE